MSPHDPPAACPAAPAARALGNATNFMAGLLQNDRDQLEAVEVVIQQKNA
jgi:hypothetical protein